MPAITLNGTVQNVFTKPASADRQTGELRPATAHVQILAENELEDGEKRLEIFTLKVQNPDSYRKLMGQFVRVPAGCFAKGGEVFFYALRGQVSAAAA